MILYKLAPGPHGAIWTHFAAALTYSPNAYGLQKKESAVRAEELLSPDLSDLSWAFWWVRADQGGGVG